MENCKECINTKNTIERLAKLEEGCNFKNNIFESRISNLERRVDVSDEKFKQVFEKLDEIINILRLKESRLPNLIYSVIGIIIGGVGSGAIMWLVTK